MKRLLLILILTLSFQTLIKADDIKDFEIEGMSIGDSLLDHYSKGEIENFHKINYPGSKKFYQLGFIIQSEQYDGLNINLKTSDQKYIIYAIRGIKNFDNNLDECLKQKTKIIEQISLLIKKTKKIEYQSNFSNTYGKSISYATAFKLNNGTIDCHCTKWDKKDKNIISNGWFDSLGTSVANKLWTDWLDNEAYN